jgi:hypothetical protein
MNNRWKIWSMKVIRLFNLEAYPLQRGQFIIWKIEDEAARSNLIAILK